MAPHNGQYRPHYDPVGSQYNQQQHQNYVYPSQQQPQQQHHSTQSPQPQTSAPPGYQPAYTTGYSSTPYYNYQTTESRAAETLSHLSAQEHSTSRSSTAQYDNSDRAPAHYDTSGRAEASWNNTDRSSTAHHQHDNSSWHSDHASASVRRATNNPSPLYQNQTARPPSTTSNYSPAQSYAQPQQSSASTYPYNSYPRADQSRGQAGSNQTTAYDFPTSQFRPASPYLSRQQQQQQQQAHRSSVSSAASTAARDQGSVMTPANVGQPRAPSVTPSLIQQQASASYGRQSHPPDQSHPPITVDPTQVYDPWPEQQRKLAEARRKAELEEKRRAEEEAKKKAEEDAIREAEEEAQRKIEEAARKKAEEKRAAEEARRKAEEDAKRRAEEEIRKAEEEKRKADEEAAKRAETMRHVREIADYEEARKKRDEEAKQQRDSARQQQHRPPAASTSIPLAPAMTTVVDTRRFAEAAMGMKFPNPKSPNLETEMAAIFRKMREMNQMDPQMFARMWEQERQSHLSKSQTPVPATAQVQPPPPSAPVPPQPPRVGAPVQSRMPTPPTAYAVPPAAVPSASVAGPSHPPANAPKPRKQTSVPLPPGGNSNAIWPPGKKANLAELAARWINARKENTNKQITTESVMALLAPNPSYMTLCESLEKMGLSIDRAQFARALLSVVPSADKAHGKQPSPAAPPPAQLPATTAAPSPIVQLPPSTATKPKGNIGKFKGQRGRPRKEQVAALSISQNTIDLTGHASDPSAVSQAYQSPVQIGTPIVAYQSGYDYIPPPDDMPDYSLPGSSYQPPPPQAAEDLRNKQPRKYFSPYFPSNTAAPKPTPPPAVPRLPPANKNEAARKRTFAELIDLSAANSDSEEDMPPAKAPNTLHHDTTMSMPAANHAPPPHLQQYLFTGHVLNDQYPVPHVLPNSPAPAMNLAGQLRGQTLVQPIRRGNVARKSSYDPRTICRDVLLATGRHPDSRPLNTHLNDMHEFLKKHSQNVEQDKFDLATIRWDLIDPGEPIDEPLPEDEKESTNADDRVDVEADNENDREGESEAAEADTEEPLVMSDIPPTTERASSSKNTTPAPSVSVQIPIYNSSTLKRTTGRPRKPFPDTKRKPGRPPGQSLPVQASVSDGRSPAVRQPAASSVNALDTPRSANSKQQTPTTEDMSTPTGLTGYAAFRQVVQHYDADGNPIKKKGRPVGWRKSIHGKAAVVAAAGGNSTSVSSAGPAVKEARRNVAAPNYNEVKRRNRQPKAETVPAKEPDVEFNVYKCEWEECGSELHNVDTLRKHVIKIHGKPTSEDDYECAWLGCFQDSEITSFDDMASWMEHMENEHVKPVARKLGDGPRAGLSGGS